VALRELKLSNAPVEGSFAEAAVPVPSNRMNLAIFSM
jgi:hypothetical protein